MKVKRTDMVTVVNEKKSLSPRYLWGTCFISNVLPQLGKACTPQAEAECGRDSNPRSALTWTLASVTQAGILKIVLPSPPTEILYVALYLELGRETTVFLATPTRSGASVMLSWG